MSIEQWKFPIGGHVATLTIESPSTQVIEPEDMDALFEAGLLFKRQIITRHKARLAREAQPDFEI
jgi:hypothetical protein